MKEHSELMQGCRAYIMKYTAENLPYTPEFYIDDIPTNDPIVSFDPDTVIVMKYSDLVLVSVIYSRVEYDGDSARFYAQLSERLV